MSFQYDKSVYLSASHITGKSIHVFPGNEKQRRLRFSAFITGSMIVVDILCVAAVFYLKFHLVRVLMYKNGDVIAEVVNAVQIQLLAHIYTVIGKTRISNIFCLTLFLYAGFVSLNLFPTHVLSFIIYFVVFFSFFLFTSLSLSVIFPKYVFYSTSLRNSRTIILI